VDALAHRHLVAIADPARKVFSRSRWTRSQLSGIAKELRFELVLSKGRVTAVNRVAGEGRGRRLGAHDARTGDGLPTADPIRSDPIRGVEAELYVCGVRERLRESTKSRPRRPRHRLGREGLRDDAVENYESCRRRRRARYPHPVVQAQVRRPTARSYGSEGWGSTPSRRASKETPRAGPKAGPRTSGL
jgi:hypothetical protein